MSHIAVIQTGGKQYLVKPGDVLDVERLEDTEGSKLGFDALFVANEDGSGAKVGTPKVAGAKVSATVLAHGRADKVTIVKFKAKVRYKRKAGHRQLQTTLKVDDIKA